MKKILILFIALIASTPWVKGELNEVRGVLTKVSEYWEGNSTRYAYSFTNENNYPVWIDAELWGKSSRIGDPDWIMQTKSFTLQPHETYIWKDKFYYNRNDLSNSIYLKFKAYKAE